MALVDRAKNMVLAPAAEWPVVAGESASIGSLYTGYVIPLALIGPVCSFVSSLVILHHPIIAILSGALSFVFELIAIFVVALIADALVTSFGGAKNGTQSLKWVAYASTPRLLAGVALLIPILGPFIVLLASLYGLYVLYLGALPVMRVPQDKAVGYTAVVVVCYIVLVVILTIIIGTIIAALTFGTLMQSGAYTH